MELTDQIAVLERALQEHIRKWEMFFSGIEKTPPQIERERINRRIRFLSEQTVNRRAEQFRIEQLQHRFMTYSMNWERMLREREEGRKVQPHTNPELRPPPEANVPPPSPVERGESEALFDRYCAAKTEHGVEVGVDRKTFDEQIASQKKKIEERLGREVHFELRVEDDQVRVVARKIKKK
ncbi:MAG: hypothetical protein IFK91_01885 [Acidobacteria bacterium]|nr:hypothetical protein [Candidatus Sulfomarinibacter sp. MAG AM1]